MIGISWRALAQGHLLCDGVGPHLISRRALAPPFFGVQEPDANAFRLIL